jgi:hypothetical protein
MTTTLSSPRSTTPVPQTERETSLLSAVDKFLGQFRAWAENDGPDLLTEEFQDSLAEMADEFSVGDMPSSCRDIDDCVRDLGRAWAEYESYVSQQEPMPRSTFWEAVSRLDEVRQGEKPWERKPLESVRMLKDGGATLRNIAVNYSYSPTGEDRNRVGPFWRNGVCQEHLVQQEYDNPGSVIPAGWIHPMHAAEMQNEAIRRQRRLRRVESLVENPTHASPPESIEQLLREGVNVPQIARMHRVSIAVVLQEAEAKGITISDPRFAKPGAAVPGDSPAHAPATTAPIYPASAYDSPTPPPDQPEVAARQDTKGVGKKGRAKPRRAPTAPSPTPEAFGDESADGMFDPDDMQILDENGNPIQPPADDASELLGDFDSDDGGDGSDGNDVFSHDYPDDSVEARVIAAHRQFPAQSALAISRQVGCALTVAATVIREHKARNEPAAEPALAGTED